MQPLLPELKDQTSFPTSPLSVHLHTCFYADSHLNHIPLLTQLEVWSWHCTTDGDQHIAQVVGLRHKDIEEAPPRPGDGGVGFVQVVLPCHFGGTFLSVQAADVIRMAANQYLSQRESIKGAGKGPSSFGRCLCKCV